MATVPPRTGLLADVSNSEFDNSVMKASVSKITTSDIENRSLSFTEDIASFSPRTELANKLSHTSISNIDENAELGVLSDSPPQCTPNRRNLHQSTIHSGHDTYKSNLMSSYTGRLSPLLINDEQTKFPELEDSQPNNDSIFTRQRSSTFTEVSVDSGCGSSLQSWTDSQRSTSSSFSPSSTRQLSVIKESSNFSPSISFSRETSRDSFSNLSSCPTTPTHRVIALRSRNSSSRGSPLTPKHCSPSPSLPQHIQALVRGGFKKVSSDSSLTSPKVENATRKIEKQSLFSAKSTIDNQKVFRQSFDRQPRASSLKRVATSDHLEMSSERQQRLLAFSPSGEAKKLKSHLESIKEGVSSAHLPALPADINPTKFSLAQSSSVSSIATPPQQAPASQPLTEKCTPLAPSSSVASSVTVTTTTPTETSSSHQAPPDTCMIGDGSKPYLLPCRPHESTVLIDCAELANLIAGKYSSQVKEFHIIDCRYPYEHQGGHIKGAVNHPKADPLLKQFFGEESSSVVTSNDENNDVKRSLLIFHCEFSSKRAPDMVKHFRKCDRHRNRNNYPQLKYPEVYMLAGGYKAFYEYCCSTGQCHLLEPHGGYTPMHAEEKKDELRRWKKYKTMSAVEDRLQKPVSHASVSPLSTNGMNCGEISLSQEQSSIGEKERPYRKARRNPLIRRQLSSFTVPHQSCNENETSPMFRRTQSSKFVDETTPLFSRILNDDVNSENRPPSQNQQ